MLSLVFMKQVKSYRYASKLLADLCCSWGRVKVDPGHSNKTLLLKPHSRDELSQKKSIVILLFDLCEGEAVRE